MTSIYLIRHASYVHDRIDGRGPWLDLGLSDEGRAQAHALKARLLGAGGLRPDLFLCSTERRAVETAAVIAEALGQTAIPDPELVEWGNDGGTMDSATFLSKWRALTERERPYHRFAEGGETGIEFTTRVHCALHRILTEHRGKTIALMTHGGVVEAAFQYFFGCGAASLAQAYPAVGNTSITHWRQEEGASGCWVLEASNDLGHLRPP